MSTSKSIFIGSVTAIALALAAAYAWFVDDCSSSQLPGRYRLAGREPIELTLSPGGLAKIDVGNRTDIARWEFEIESGNVFLEVSPTMAQELRRRSTLPPLPTTASAKLQFGVEASCNLVRKRLYLNRDSAVYLSYVGPPA